VFPWSLEKARRVGAEEAQPDYAQNVSQMTTVHYTVMVWRGCVVLHPHDRTPMPIHFEDECVFSLLSGKIISWCED